MKSKSANFNIAIVSLFGAIIIVMALVPFLGYIPLGFMNATLLHVPVIIASIVLGPKYGAILGFVFGATSLVQNTVSPNLTSFVFSPFYAQGNCLSLIICFIPRILVGIVPHYVYQFFAKHIKKKGEVVSLALAGIAGSLTNTILVMGGIYLFFGKEYAAAKNLPVESLFGVIMGIVGLNGVPEAIVAAILTCAIAKALLVYKRKKILD